MFICDVCVYAVIDILCHILTTTNTLDLDDRYNCAICEHAVIDIAYNFGIMAATLYILGVFAYRRSTFFFF